MSQQTLRIATRKSPLALWQANFVGDALARYWPELHIELVPMITSGDRFLKDKLQTIGGKGLFVKELEQALLDKRADIAVHSMKDVPAGFPEGLTLAAICERESPFDALVSRQGHMLSELPLNSTVGTSSLRRQTQLLHVRSDLQIKVLRGNIHTRLEKLQKDDYDAIILAEAGLTRMNFADKISQRLEADIMLPACGQGALGIECRAEDANVMSYLRPLHHADSALCVGVERQVNALLGGNCHAPLAVFCTHEPNNRLTLRARLLSEDGQRVLSDSRNAPASEASALACACAEALFAQGAREILESVR